MGPFLRPDEKYKAVEEGGVGRYSSHGASGAIMGLLSCMAYLNPTQRLYLFFFIPCTTRGLLLGLALDESWGVLTGKDLLSRLFGMENVDHAAHLGGLAGGALFSRLALRRLRIL